MNFADLQAEQIDWARMAELNVASVKTEMRSADVAALLTCTPDNWRYVTGVPVHTGLAYYSSNLSIVSLEKDAPILLPLGDLSGYMEIVAPWVSDLRPLPLEGTREARQPLGTGAWMEIITGALEDAAADSQRIAIDAATPYPWKEALQARLPKAQFIDAGDILRRARLIKNAEEQKAIRKACLIGELGIQAGLGAVEAGRTEAQIAAVVEYEFRANGAEYLTGYPFVIAGDYPTLGLLAPTDKLIRQGDLVRIDSGCSYGGYFSDFSRTTYVGSDPGDEVRNAYEAVYESLMAGAEAARPGVSNVELHRVINDTLKKRSGKRYELGWFVGHGLGVGVHEDPMIGAAGEVEEFEMMPGMYFCLEPAIVVPGRGMIGLEDDYLMTENGVEVLTRTEFHL